MKKTFTLIIICFVVISMMGNTEKKSIQIQKMHDGKEASRLQKARGIGTITNYQVRNLGKTQNYLNSAQALKQRLDSIVNRGFDPTINLFANSSKSEYAYNANGKLTKEVYYEWNKVTKKWVGSWRSEYTYNSNGNLTQDMSYNWVDSTKNWVNSYKTDYTFNNKGEIANETRYDWDKETNNWVVWMKNEKTYNANGSLTQEIFYYWDKSTSAFTIRSKREYAYNTNGKITQETSSNYMQGMANPWFPNYKYEYTYGVNGNETCISYNWDIITNQWVIYSKDETNYDSKGNQIEWISYDWDKTSGKFVGDSKEQNTYDTNGNMTLYFSFNWDPSASKWVENSKEEYTYNNSYLFNEIVYPFVGMESYFMHMITGGNNYDWDITTSQWIVSGNFKMYYSQMNVSGIEDISANELKIYPNPATGFVTFDLKDASEPATIEIFDIQGKKVIFQLLPVNKQIQVSQLNSGMYFYKINQNGQIFNGKIMIK